MAQELVAIVAGIKTINDILPEYQKTQTELAAILRRRATDEITHKTTFTQLFDREFWALGCNRSFARKKFYYAFTVNTTEAVGEVLAGNKVRELRSPMKPTAVPSLDALPDDFKNDVLGRLVIWKVRREREAGTKLDTLDESGVFPTHSRQVQDKGTGIYLIPSRTVQWMLIPKT